MRVVLIALSLVAVGGCATTTPREKIASGVTQTAFGAPLILGGTFGTAVGAYVLGNLAISMAEACKDPTSQVCRGLGSSASELRLQYGVLTGLSVAELAVGSFLLWQGTSTLRGGLDEMATTADAMRAAESARESAVDEALKRGAPLPQKACTKGWDCPEDNGKP